MLGDCEVCGGCTDDTCRGCGDNWCGGTYMGWGCETTAKGLRAKLKSDRGDKDLWRSYRRLQLKMRVQYRGARPIRSRKYRNVPEVPVGAYGYIDMYGFQDTGTGYWTVRFDGHERKWSVYEGDLRPVTTSA